jgi:hypothetical protein
MGSAKLTLWSFPACESTEVQWSWKQWLEAFRSSVHWEGPVDYIASETGIWSPRTPDAFVDELGNAMLYLAGNPQIRAKMGEAGRLRVAELYDWRVKARTLLKIYSDVLAVGSSQTKVMVR